MIAISSSCRSLVIHLSVWSVICVLGMALVGCSTPTPTPMPTPTPTPADAQVIRYAVFPAPPYMIGANEGETEISGIDVAIMQEIAQRANLQIEFYRCPWMRCLELLKSGEADMLSSVYKKPEREEFLFYFDDPYLDRLPIAFYYLKGKSIVVEQYEDIYQFNTVGILRGASYFAQFDNDTQVNKYDVTSQDQLFPMLLNGRFDAIAGYVPTENYRIVVEGYRDQIERSQYEYSEVANVYMTMSKKSPLAPRFSEFNAINRQLMEEGVISRIVTEYYEKYH